MRVLLRQFLGENHSWSVCGWGIANALLDKGHQVDLFSTDGIKNLPLSLKSSLIGYIDENKKLVGKLPNNNYDCQISYTAMINFPQYLSHGTKNRFGIWCYEFAGKNVLPNGFAKNYLACDQLLAPSVFAKQVFLNSGIPDNRVKVIPHGIGKEYQNTGTMVLPTKKKFKILTNIAQNHLRKNIPGLLEAYGKAFNKNDDVCLLIKGKNKPVEQPFDVSLNDCLNNFNKNYPNHAEIKILSNFIEDISVLYRSIDAVYTLSHCEGYYFPGLEAMASGKLNIAPNYGGQLDFLNKTNALLISGKEVKANPKSMYWGNSNNAIWFQPDINDAVDKLKYAYCNFETLNSSINEQKSKIYQQYSWSNVADQILTLCN